MENKNSKKYWSPWEIYAELQKLHTREEIIDFLKMTRPEINKDGEII